MPTSKSYRDVVSEAVNDMALHGFDSVERLAYWEERIRRAAEAEFGPGKRMDDMLRDFLASTYARLIEKGGIAKFHSGAARWTLQRVAPELRAELDRRILASANLIKLNRKKRVEETLQRFSGWATSLPKGGSAEPEKREAKARIAKPVAQEKFEERRVLIDQGHKLTSSLNDVVATGGGAIAAMWRSHWRQPGYDYRPDHKERDEVVYLLRGTAGQKSWAEEKGFVKAGTAGTTDSITRPAEEPFCRCSYVYIYSLRELFNMAPDMLTAKGRAAMEDAATRVREMA